MRENKMRNDMKGNKFNDWLTTKRARLQPLQPSLSANSNADIIGKESVGFIRKSDLCDSCGVTNSRNNHRHVHLAATTFVVQNDDAIKLETGMRSSASSSLHSSSIPPRLPLSAPSLSSPASTPIGQRILTFVITNLILLTRVLSSCAFRSSSHLPLFLLSAASLLPPSFAADNCGLNLSGDQSLFIFSASEDSQVGSTSYKLPAPQDRPGKLVRRGSGQQRSGQHRAWVRSADGRI